MTLPGAPSVEQMCQWAGLSRASFYRSLQQQEPAAEEVLVRSAIQEIVLAHRRRYGYRRVGAELRRRGLCVNHKRVVRLMREDQLLALQPRSFVVTTDSGHELEVALNLAATMTLSGLNQLWVADLTYLRLQREFVFLAVILDAYSRKVVGWSLGPSLAATLPLAALEQALAERQPGAGLVHHSDRGVQYAAKAYAERLRAHGIVPSMSRPAYPYDNARCESFIRTLKREEIQASEYRDQEHLRENLTAFIEGYYNRLRLHSALGYRTPEEVEQASRGRGGVAHVKMSFFRSEEIFPSDASSH
jgi:putative transposase